MKRYYCLGKHKMKFMTRTTFVNGPRGEFYLFLCENCDRKGAVRVSEFLASTRPATQLHLSVAEVVRRQQMLNVERSLAARGLGRFQ